MLWLEALTNRKIYAVGLDVYKGEPKINLVILNQPTAFILPHLGSATKKTRTAMADLAMIIFKSFSRQENAKIQLISTISN